MIMTFPKHRPRKYLCLLLLCAISTAWILAVGSLNVFPNRFKEVITTIVSRGPSPMRGIKLDCTCTSSGPFRAWRNSGLVTSLSHPPLKTDCQQLREGNETEQNLTLAALNKWTNPVTDDEFYAKISNCDYVREIFSPDNFYNSDAEIKFPLAYAIAFHNSPQQIVRLLKVIYRPQNIYCLHPDGKADRKLIEGFRSLSLCLDNVFVPQKLVEVYYTHFSMVEAQLLCFKELSTIYKHWGWKYAMIMCGKELPVSSNRRIVDTLIDMNGASVLNVHEGLPVHFEQRFGSHYKLDPATGKLIKTGPRKEELDVKIYKSTNYIVASRSFVGFLLKSKRVEHIRQFMSTARMADEEFYATAYMLPEAPKGHCGSNCEQVTGIRTFFTKDMPKHVCTGKSVHFSCILSILDLPLLTEYSRSDITYFFFNKYFMDYDHVVMDCMEKSIVKQNKWEFARDYINN